MTLKIATWNVNSLRVRLEQVLTWLGDKKPDILALQETKVTDDLFPTEIFEKAGYHAYFTGQKTYNGVAILSRKPLEEIQKEIPRLGSPDKRVLGASLGKLRIWNVYVPNGESPVSEKYHYKLNWLKELQRFLEEELRKYPELLILGDFNIAPEARDVYDPQVWEGQVLFSKPERQALERLMQLGLEDCFRLHNEADKQYTWWDYRLNAYKRQLGLRIDHILASEALAKSCTRCVIDKIPRSWERPSDHTPVMAEFTR